MGSPQRINVERLVREQIRLHRAGMPLALGAGHAIGVLLVMALWTTADRTRLLTWLATGIAVATINLVIRQRHRTERAPGADDATWRRRYLFGMALRGLNWGACSLLLWIEHDPAAQALLTVAVVATGAITLAALAFDRTAAWTFALPTLMPLLLQHFQSGDIRSLALVAMLLVIGAAIAQMARQSHRRARHNEALKDAESQQLAALLRSERQLNGAEQVAGLGSFEWFPPSGDLRWSDEHYRRWGLQPGSVTPSYEVFRAGIHPDDLAHVETTLTAALGGGRLYDCQHRILWPDRSVRVIHGRGEVFYDDAGQPARMIGTVLDITDRLRLDESLRIVEFAMDAITDPVSVIDQDQVYRLVNNAWCESNLLTREQALGKTLSEIYPVVFSTERRDAVRDSIALGQERVVRSPSPSKGSAGRLIETRYFPFNHPQVPWRGAVMITRDVTAEAASQHALAASLDNLRLTLNATGDAIFASDASGPDQPVLFVNEQLLQLWNIPQHMANQVTAALIIEHARPHFIDPDREVARIVDIIAGGQPAEDRLTLRDGRVLVRRCIPTTEHHRQVRVWGFRDITVEAGALASLRDAEARQRALLDAFPGYIAAMDKDLNYVHVNSRMAALLGTTPDRLVGVNIAGRVDPATAQALHRDVLLALSGAPVTLERHDPPRAGRPAIDLLITLAAGRGPGTEPLCYAFGTDITELKRTQAALLAAKDDAERANQAKSHFLSNMSHELRTPLNAVLGFGQLLARNASGNLHAKQLGQVQEIVRAGQHLLALINDLLDLARIESGHMSISLEPVALPGLVDECLQLVAPMALTHGVRVAPFDPEAMGHMVRADRMKLKQVLLNLLSNAIKYNRREGIVSLHCHVVEPGQLRLEVRDTGQGLDGAAQARLFRAFERLDADKTAIEGTGIGLALSRRLMQLMQGDIGVESQPGAGSCFWLRLARVECLPTTPPGTDSAPGELRSATDAAAMPARVLCIDDNPVNLALMEGLLERHLGLRLSTTTEPLRGLELAARELPDLILLDIQLPGIDGLEVLRRLRAERGTAAIPVIAVSADAMPEAVQRCLEAGFADYVTKPVAVDRLLAAIDKALGHPD